MSGNAFGRIVRLVARRPIPVLALTLAVALGGAALALRLEPSAATDTLVSRSSDSFRATERFRRDFGDEAVVVLVKGPLTRTVLTADLLRVLGLEGCLSGNIPEKPLAQALAKNRKNPARGLPPACGELAKLHPARAVYGPATFINTSASQISDEYLKRSKAATLQGNRAARAARKLSAARGYTAAEQERLARAAREAVMAKFELYVARIALRYGLRGLPSINDPNFVNQVVFDSTKPGVPKSRFGYLFPSKNAALIQIRMRPELSESQRRRAVELVKEATRSRVFRPKEGATYVVSGVPVVSEALADAVQNSIVILLDRRGARDGGHADARVPHTPAAPAAGARAGGGRGYLRGAVAGRRQPDHGLDRSASRAHRARGGLCDPVPGALRRAALATAPAA